MSAMHNPDRSLDAAAFVTRWQGRAGSERANAQIFVGELCTLLGVPLPDPSQEGRPAPRSNRGASGSSKILRLRHLGASAHSVPLAHGPVIASVMPGACRLANRIRPSGLKQAPHHSVLRRLPATAAVLPTASSWARLKL